MTDAEFIEIKEWIYKLEQGHMTFADFHQHLRKLHGLSAKEKIADDDTDKNAEPEARVEKA